MSDAEAPALLISPREILAMLWRRRWWLVLPAVLGVLAAIGLVVSRTPLFKSTATLLIDSQTVPTSLVPSPMTNMADERIGKIRQQIVSRGNLEAIVLAERLYAKERASMDLEKVVAIMRNAIAIDLVGARAAQGEGAGGSTIAFSLSFTYPDPAKAQRVTTRLTDMFLAADKRIRTEQAAGTSGFLADRSEEMRRQLVALEERRRSIEARYMGALPSQAGLTAQTEATLRSEVSRVDAETQGLIQQNSNLAIRQRELQRAPTPGADPLLRAEARLNELTARYSDSHPDVAAARVALEKQRAAVQREAVAVAGAEGIENELRGGRERIQTLANRRAELLASLAASDRRSALAPQASYELTRIEREYENIRRQYEDFREKQLEAQVAENLQTEDKGERFSVVDAANFPLAPLGAKAHMLLLAGIAGGFGGGLVLVIVWELATGRIHGEAGVLRALGAAPLAIIPVLPADGAGRWFGRLLPRRRQVAARGIA